MKPKQLIVLAIVLAVAVAAALVISKDRNKAGQGNASQIGVKVFPDLDVNAVAKVAIVAPKAKVTLSQKGGNGAWGVEDRAGYAADVAKLRTFILDLSKLKIAQTTTVGASQLGRLGLVAPDSGEGVEEEKGTVVEFESGDGTKLVKATIGKEFKTGGGSDPMTGGYATGRYLLVDGRPDVFVVSDQLYSLQSDPAGWLKKENFRVEKPKSVAVTYADGEGGFTLSKEEESGKFTLADISETEALDESKTGGYGNIFSSGSFADVLVGDAATDEQTGLDKPDTVNIETFDGFKYVVSIGKKITEGGEGEDSEGGAPATVRYPVRYTVSAELPTERKVEGEETEEQKKEREAAFELKQKTLKEKLEAETALAGNIYLLESWVIDQVLKKRSDLIKAPEPEGEAADGSAATNPLSPGVSVATPPVAVPPANGDAPKKPMTATTPPVSLEDAIKKANEESTENGDSPSGEQKPGDEAKEGSEAVPGEDAPGSDAAADGDAEATVPPATEEVVPAEASAETSESSEPSEEATPEGAPEGESENP
jgi:hypothetical protein